MRVLLAALLCFWSSPAFSAGWLRADTPNFIIYSQGSEKALRGFAVKVERFDAVLRHQVGITGPPNPQKLTIYILPSATALQRLPGIADSVAGFYRARSRGSFAVVNDDRANSKLELDADAVLFHEYAHHFMYRYFPNAYPAWYSEGFAEFLAGTQFSPEGNAKIGIPPYYRAFGLVEAAPISVAKILTSDVSDYKDIRTIDAFYGRSWLLVHYLSFSEKRRGQLEKYLTGMREGKPSAIAAKEAFGDIVNLNAELTDYLHKSKISYVMTKTTFPPTEKITIAALPPGEAASMTLRIAVANSDGGDEFKRLLPEIRALAARYPNEIQSHILLGDAEYAAGNDAAAISAADAALAIDSKAPRALLLKGEALLRVAENDRASTAEQWKTARSYVIRANRSNPDDAMPLLLYYQSFGMEGVAPPAIATDGVARAYQLAPEAGDIRLTYAYALAAKKDYVTAIRLVKTIAYDPHPGPFANQSLKVLTWLEAQRDGKSVSAPDLSADPD